MTDKEKLHQILSSLWKNDDSVGKTYYNQALQDVQTAIDLQEEPTGNPLGSTHAEFRTAVESLGISQEEHDAIVDKYLYGKEPELVDVDDLPKEEPVSEELEQAIDAYLKSYWGGEKEKQDWPFLKKMAIHFAQWQKEQINEVLLSEVLPCFMHGGEADEVVAKLEEVLNQKK